MPNSQYHKSILLLNVLIFVTCFSHAQSVSDGVNQYIRDTNARTIPDALLKEASAPEVITSASLFFQDTLSQIRMKAFSLINTIGIQSKKVNVRQEAVNKLVQASRDTDGGNVGTIWTSLSRFNKEDFSAAAKDSLKNRFRRKPAHMNELLKLMGYLEMKDMTEEIRPLSSSANTNKRDRWAALLSLARMGDAASVQSLMQRVRKLPVNDDVVYEVFPDLAYTRQPDAISYMVTALNSDEKNCLSADAENEIAIPCAYRVMEQLAPVIEGYPLQLDASGDVKTKDYEKALVTVRNWIGGKGKNYKIRVDGF
jgi:HEAT repeat protein